ncbi:MAG TPA: BON domain-containing protein [Pyrinomonadaceae bacterium]|jgi:osmotically-inducible protein OsmY|nr:BON domain-containing protein [Pyrinomonadaceae bacterium]
MADRYSDRDFGRYGGDDDERREDDYGRDRGVFGRGPDYDPAPRGYRVGRDYDDYERDRDYFSGPRNRSYGSYGSYGDYTSREYGRDAGRDYEGTGRVYEGGGRDYERHERTGRDYGRDYGRDAGREHEDGRDTDYGRTTSRFFTRDRGETLPGQVPPDYGDDHDRRRGRDYDDYGRRDREGFRFGRGERRGHEMGGRDREAGDRGRGWVDRAADEVLSWFGDEDAERRRHLDESRSGRTHRGRGPKNYRRSDERIREDINDRLTEHDWLDASDIEVSVLAGEVTLSGAVESRHAKRLAEDIAESVVGVTNVQNNLRVRRERTSAPSSTGDYAAGSTLTPGRASATTDLSGLTGTADTTADAETTHVTDSSSRAAGSNS